jgi:3',5'-cyclic AMP phosphodiesterase CpdA
MDRPARRPRYTIVQVSDPHIPRDGFLFDRVDACARVQASVEMIAAAGCHPDVLILSGDVADRGEAEAYARLRPVIRAALYRFGARLLVAPGNHDDVALMRGHLLGREPAHGPLDELFGRDVRLILSGHTHRVSAGTLGGVPVWVSPSTGSHADVLVRNGFRGHAGGGFTRVDILGDGEIVATFVPLTGHDEILYEVRLDESELPADHGAPRP